MKKARILISYRPAGCTANIKGLVLRVLHSNKLALEVDYQGSRIWFTHREVSRA